MKTLRWLLMGMVILSAACARATSGKDSRPATEAPVDVAPARPAASSGTTVLTFEEAIQSGDWAAAQAILESEGEPSFPASVLNRIMIEGLRLAMSAEGAEARRHIEGALALVRKACRCLDDRGRLIPGMPPKGFRGELYLTLYHMRGATSYDPLYDWATEQVAQRHRLNREEIFDRSGTKTNPVGVCRFGDRIFVVAGFWIFDLEGSLQQEAPGLDSLSEGERLPRLYYVFCDEKEQKIQWVNVSGGGRGVSLEAKWDGEGFRWVETARINLAAQTYEEVRKQIEAGRLEEAFEAYYDKGFTNEVDADPELAALALRQGMTVARQRAEAGDVARARRALHAAFSIAAFRYRLDSGTFLPVDWEQRPRSLEKWAQEAFGADPQAPSYARIYRDALTEYAALLVQDHRPQEAEPILRALTILAPNHAPAYLYLGDVLWDQGKPEEARRFYQRYQELTPGGPWPDRVRERAP
ncbi:tetratricopeptide repeat protein [Thermoflexus sp.]|uniref:tetratricopeptide repeat protein n=1 Tax=Thermoflexus sp. TaxID=1969742 RepID=UPI002ADE1A91|nr:tetratricopeptide repeat protein [Thermoflexus sp.]